MGVDLSVLPIRHPNIKWYLATQRLMFDRDTDLFNLIRKLRPKPLNQEVDIYEDEGIKKRTADPYGDSFTFLTSKDFNRLKNDKKLKFEPAAVSPANLAVLGYCCALPEDHPIVLYWH